MEEKKVVEDGEAIHTMDGKRQRSLTEKGLLYSLERKDKAMSKVCKELIDIESALTLKMSSSSATYEEVRQPFRDWLISFESLLELRDQFLELVNSEPDTTTRFSSRLKSFESDISIFMKFKSTVQCWISNKDKDRQSVITTASSRKSTSSVLSAQLKEQQTKAELMAKAKSLKRKQQLEIERLRLQMEEEQLDLDTKLAMSDARSKVLIEFQVSDNKSMISLEPVTHNERSRYFEPYEPVMNYDNNEINQPLHDNIEINQPLQFIPQIPPARPALTRNLSDDVIQTVVQQLRKPVPEIKKFSGNPLDYRKFIRQFRTKIIMNTDSEDERMNYLEQFTCGEANKIVNGFGYLDAERGFPAAMRELEERYGEEEVIVNAFIKQAMEWPNIKSDNSKGLDEFAIFLSECSNAIQSMPAIRVLNYSENIRRLVCKLPYQYQEKFRNVVQRLREQRKTVTFRDLESFVKNEAKKANDPVFGKEAMQNMQKNEVTNTTGKAQGKKQFPSVKKKMSFATSESTVAEITHPKTVQTSSREAENPQSAKSKPKPCVYCESTQHSIEKCERFIGMSYSEKVTFVKTYGLCFKCLRRGHMSKDCRSTVVCAKCQRRHQTMFHLDEEVKASAVYSCVDHDMGAGGHDGKCTMVIIPVKVKLKEGLQAVDLTHFLILEAVHLSVLKIL